MKHWILLVGCLLAPKLFADHYQINPALSSINFATTKKQYIIEPATISKLSGQLSNEGTFNAKIDLKHLDTINPIRDARLMALFFEYGKYPNITVSANINTKDLPASGAVNTISTKAKLSIWQQSKDIELDLLIANTGQHLVVSSRKAIVINASDFGIPAENLNKLAGTVGNIDIATTVAVNMQLSLDLIKH